MSVSVSILSKVRVEDEEAGEVSSSTAEVGRGW